MKNTKFFIMLLSICLLLVTGCVEDDHGANSPTPRMTMQGQRVSLSSMDPKLATAFKDKISQPENWSVQNQEERFIYDSYLRMYVDWENGWLVAKDGEYFYTFQAYREGERNLENIVYAVRESGAIDAYLAKYYSKPEDIKNMSAAELAQVGVVFKEFLPPGMVENCDMYTIWTPMYVTCTETHSNGYTCGAEFAAYTYEVCSITFTTGGTPSDSGAPPPSGVPTLGGGQGPGGSGPVIVTIPLATSPEFERQTEFTGLHLQTNGVYNLWAALTPKQKGEVLNYLEDSHDATSPANHYDIDNVAFAIESIIAMSQGATVNFPDEIIVNPSFINNPKVMCIANKMFANLSHQSYFKKTMTDMFASNKTAHVRFDVSQLPSPFNAVTVPKMTNPNGPLYEIHLDIDFVNNASTIEIANHLMHELMHAELLHRLYKLGMITNMSFDWGTWEGQFLFSGGTGLYVSFTDQPSYLTNLINAYLAYPNQSQWTHNIMTAENCVQVFTQNLLEVYPSLNNPASGPITAINSDINNTFGTFTLTQVMTQLAWVGLEETAAFVALHPSGSTQEDKHYYIESAIRQFSNHTCTP